MESVTKEAKTLESVTKGAKDGQAGHDLCIGEEEEMVESRRTRKSFVRASSLHSKGNLAK